MESNIDGLSQLGIAIHLDGNRQKKFQAKLGVMETSIDLTHLEYYLNTE